MVVWLLKEEKKRGVDRSVTHCVVEAQEENRWEVFIGFGFQKAIDKMSFQGTSGAEERMAGEQQEKKWCGVARNGKADVVWCGVEGGFCLLIET